jgi:hypothetical protein
MPIVFGIFGYTMFRALVLLESSSDWLWNEVPKLPYQVLHRHSGVDKAQRDPAAQVRTRGLGAPWGFFGLDYILLREGSFLDPCYETGE